MSRTFGCSWRGCLAVALAAGLAAQAAGARAADAIIDPAPAPPEPPQAQVFQWTGPYLGAYGTYNFLSADLSGLADPHVDGVAGGVYAGYNYQFDDNWVAGFEGTAGLSGADGGQSGVNVEQGWEASLRGRLGYAYGDSLVYGLAGLAGTEATVSTAAGSDSGVLLGWQIGAGLETMLSHNVTGRIEYDYSDYGSESLSPGTPTTLDLSGHAVRLGIGLKF